jgi:hypothetical protein
MGGGGGSQLDLEKRNSTPVLISFMTGAARTEWIQKQLMHREEEFTELRPINIKVCPWNVGCLCLCSCVCE